ncbi:peptidase [Pedobacter sp. KBW01]|uniref:serine hydrolase domain-containing protein n=1 Tax=Pedobacter sp. KBW01 TaxID=2153364 RepID=UPI000F5948AB|nr:serine hydrolase domain-containing protein [Pedobacter sp. KBW01]RQO77903.1 peptidase [Pedobacter sp. KBW01]
MRSIATLLLCLLILNTRAQQINTAKLDSFFNALGVNQKAMGSFAVSKNGKLVYQRSLGFRTVKRDTLRADSLTCYRIGSITKVFTATMIFQLIEEGKLSPDTKLAVFYPKLPNAPEINIAQLLSHSSGLMDYVNDVSGKSWITRAHAQSELLDTIVKRAPHFIPGSKQQYCNSGYLLLAGIIEKITGKSYSKALESRISKRIGLKQTQSGIINNTGAAEASSYGMRNQWTQITDIYFPNVIGVGDILSTPADMLKFLNALSSGKLVSEKSFAKMSNFNQGDLFGMGLIKVPFYNQIGFGHNGATYGTFSMLCNFPSSGISVALSLNGQGYSLNEITIAMLSICNDMSFEIPTFKDVELSPEQLKACLGIYSNKTLPFKITITENGGKLQAQATGQSHFPLQPTSANTFRFDAAGIKIVFSPELSQMTFSQGGKSFLFNKDIN